MNVTVAPRQRTRRRFRSWPWILGLALVLLVLGIVLLVMMQRGATIDGTTDLVGAGVRGGAGPVATSWIT